MERSLTLTAPAKVNIGLDVLRRRPDGYHEVSMIMQTLTLCDYVRLTPAESGLMLTINRSDLPTDEGNIAFRAAQLLEKEVGRALSVHIDIEKHIPVAAGLAGGSTDAAAVLLGMNTLFRLGIPMDRLLALGKTLGADVPYCMMQGTALSEGIGEKLTRLSAMPACHVILAKPAASVSTKEVYEALTLNEATAHPDIPGMTEAIRKRDLPALARRMGNLLETVTIPRHPEIQRIKEHLTALGSLHAMMSGSGPTVFALFPDKMNAESAYEAMQSDPDAKEVILTEIFNP